MSITFGPVVPVISGSSVCLPVELSVRVMVSLGALALAAVLVSAMRRPPLGTYCSATDTLV